MYLLNLLFDLGRTDGLFEPSPAAPAGNPLENSSSWLTLSPATLDPPNLDPNNLPAGLNWTVIGDGPLFIPNPLGEAIGIRIAPIAGSAPPLTANSTIDLVLAFGAPIPKVTKHASPFTNAGKTVTTVIKSGNPTHAFANGWYFRIHEINLRGKRHLADRYEFAVGGIITEVVTQTQGQFGLDPEMDVGN